MVESGTAIAAMGYEGADEVQRLIDKAEKSLLRLSYRKSATDFVPIQDIVTTTVDRIGVMAEGKDATGLRTGFTDLDGLTGKLQRVHRRHPRPHDSGTAFQSPPTES